MVSVLSMPTVNVLDHRSRRTPLAHDLAALSSDLIVFQEVTDSLGKSTALVSPTMTDRLAGTLPGTAPGDALALPAGSVSRQRSLRAGSWPGDCTQGFRRSTILLIGRHARLRGRAIPHLASVETARVSGPTAEHGLPEISGICRPGGPVHPALMLRRPWRRD